MSNSSRSETIERTGRPWVWCETVSEVPGNKAKCISVNPGQQLSPQKAPAMRRPLLKWAA